MSMPQRLATVLLLCLSLMLGWALGQRPSSGAEGPAPQMEKEKGPPESPQEKWSREWVEFGDRMKPLLAVGDSEWEVLAPRIERVLALRQNVGVERGPTKVFGAMPKAPKGPKGPKGTDSTTNPADPAANPEEGGGKGKEKAGKQEPEALVPLDRLPILPGLPKPRPTGITTRTELSEAAKLVLAGLVDGVQASELRSRLTMYREARERMTHQLNKAQQELRDLLTFRQEVILVVMGVLD